MPGGDLVSIAARGRPAPASGPFSLTMGAGVADVWARTHAAMAGVPDIRAAALVWGIRLGLLAVFVTPLVVTTGTVFPFVVGKAVWSRSVIEVVAGMWLVLAIWRPAYRPRRSLLLLLLGLYLGAVLLAAVFGVSFQRSFWGNFERMGGLFDLAHWFVLAAVVLSTVRTLSEWRWLVTANLAIGAGAGLLAIAQRFDIHVVDYFQSGYGVSGSFGNPSFLAGYAMVSFMLSLALLADTLRRRDDLGALAAPVLRGFYALSALMWVWVLAETGNRGASAGLAAGLVIAGVLYVRASGSRRLQLGGLVLAGVTAGLLAAVVLGRDTALVRNAADSSPLLHRSLNLAGLDSAVYRAAYKRLVGARVAGEAFTARPLTGWGGENFRVAFDRYTRESDTKKKELLDRAHNRPMDVLATTGLVGLLAYGALWAWLGLLALRRVATDPQRRELHALAAGALVALFVYDLFLFSTAGMMIQFVLLVAWAGAPRTEPAGSPRGTDRATALRPGRVRSAVGYAAPVLVATIVALLVYSANYRAYSAGQLFLHGRGTPQELAANLDVFPPLATFGRQSLLNAAAANWDAFNPLTRPDIIQVLEDQARRAVQAEPENMSLRFAVARFYRAAASDRPELMALAREHTAEGVRLGPATPAAARASAAQVAADSAGPGGR